jgi:osomolarity two-component system, sensor histidine kinase TcsA
MLSSNLKLSRTSMSNTYTIESTAARPIISADTAKNCIILTLDSAGLVTTWNSTAALLKLGYTGEEIIDQHFSTFYSADDNDAGVPERELKLAIRNGRFQGTGWRHGKDGSRFRVNVVITPCYNGINVLVNFIQVMHHITEEPSTEKQLRTDEASESKSQFLVNIRHEIRTPIHGILSATSLLAESRLNVEQLELVGIINESASSLSSNIHNDLGCCDLPDIQTSCLDMSFRNTINSVLRDAQMEIKPGLELRTQIDPNIPDSVNGDFISFRLVFWNMVINAIRYTGAGSVNIVMSLVKEEETNIEVMTEIINTDIVVPSSTADSSFTPFTRLDNSLIK